MTGILTVCPKTVVSVLLPLLLAVAAVATTTTTSAVTTAIVAAAVAATTSRRYCCCCCYYYYHHHHYYSQCWARMPLMYLVSNNDGLSRDSVLDTSAARMWGQWLVSSRSLTVMVDSATALQPSDET